MPQAPRLDGLQVSTRPLAPARRQARETFESQGGQLALARGTRARAVGDFGSTVARAGGELVGRIWQEERQRAREVQQLSITRRLNEIDHATLRDPESGILHMQGQDPMAARDQTLEAWQEHTAALADELKLDEDGRLFLEQQRIARHDRIISQIDAHAVGALRQHEDAEYAAFLESSLASVATNAGTPEVIVETLEERDAAIRDYARRNAMGEDWTGNEIEQARNALWETAIRQNLVDGQDQAAQVMLEEAQDAGQLTGAALTRMTEAVEAGTTIAQAEQAADAIWGAHGPADDADAIDLDVMEAAARERFADNPRVMRETIGALRDRKAGVDASRASRTNAQQDAIWGAVFEGRSLAEIRRLPEFIAAPGPEQNRVAEYFRAEADRAENRAYTRSQRELTDLTSAERRRTLNGWDRYYELSDPQTLVDLPRAEILQELPTLGREHVNRLLGEQEQLQRSRDAVRNATIDSDLFKEIAYDAGFTYVYNTPSQMSQTQRAEIGRLESRVKELIAGQQGAEQRVLSFEAKRDLMRGLVDEHVMIERDFWFDQGPTNAAVVNADNADRAYIPIGEIDPDHVQQSVNYLRSRRPEFTSLSDEQIRQRARRAIERSHAARALGLGAEAELAPLREVR